MQQERVRDAEGSEAESEGESAREEVRCLEGITESLQDDKKSRCLMNKMCWSCPIEGQKRLSLIISYSGQGS